MRSTVSHNGAIKKPPQFPFELGRFHYFFFYEELGTQLLEDFGKKYGIPVHYTTSYFEDVTYRISVNELRTAMGSYCVIEGGGLPAGYSHSTTDDGCIINEFGMKMQHGLLCNVEALIAALKKQSVYG